MGDKEWKEQIRAITDPEEMLRQIVNHEHLLGYDSYYKDLRDTLISQARKVLDRG